MRRFGLIVLSAPRIHWISSEDPPQAFPDVSEACTEPDGLLAAGGDLSAERLLYAYQHGIFPWYSEGQVILWWSPDPRCILKPDQFHLSRRLKRELQNSDYLFSFNQEFSDVVAACAAKRSNQDGTWITTDMATAYRDLHSDGWAHSVEIWHQDELIGGLYGIAIGCIFFGESMFSRSKNTSKIAMLALSQQLLAHRFLALDCQLGSPHLLSLGARMIPRPVFQDMLASACNPPIRIVQWPSERVPVATLA